MGHCSVSHNDLNGVSENGQSKQNIKEKLMKKTKRISTIILSFILCLQSFAQNKTAFTCGFNNSNKQTFCDFIHEQNYKSNFGVKNTVKSIVDLVALPQNFILVECSNINNAFAYSSPNGTRYIIIDKEWINSINSKDWLTIGVLAHEIGHHLCGHTAKNTSLTIAKSQAQELEADKFAGFILQGLGATIEQALTSINTIVAVDYDDRYSTHPTKSKRIAAIKSGYNKNKPANAVATLASTFSKSPEEYFNLAWSIAPDPEYFSNLSDETLTKALTYYEEALKQNPNFTDALFNSATIWTILGKPDAAIIRFKKILETDPYDYEVLNNIGQAYSQLGYNYKSYDSFVTAIEYFNECIKINHNIGGAYLNRGIAYFNIGYFFNKGTKQLACNDYYTGCRLGEPKACTQYNNACR